MRVPSYDDLTPSIPDVSIRDTFAKAVEVVSVPHPRHAQIPCVELPGAEDDIPSTLFACLRTARVPEVMMAIARDFSPRIERHGTAAVVLDVGGLGRLLGDAHAIGAELERAASARARDIRVALARTQTAARLLTVAHGGLTVAAGDPAAALAPLPVGTLGDIYVDGPHLETFTRWGLQTLGDVAALPPVALSERMGQHGLALLRLARGIDPVPLVPDPTVPRFIESIELEWPIDALEPLSFVLARLLDPLSAALERADRAAAAIRLDLRLVTRTTHTRALQLPAAMRDARVLRTLLLLDLESHPPPAAIDVVAIEVDPAPGRIVQYSLLERASPSAETMATLMARLRALVGEDRCGSPALLDTHRPDGFALRPPHDATGHGRTRATEQHGPTRNDTGHGTTRKNTEQEWRGNNTDEHCVAPVLRRFRPPVAVRVTVEGGRPVHVAIDRRGMPGGAVVRHAGPWRTSGAWWSVAGEHWDRDEWDVAFADGVLCRLYRDRVSGVWFLEGVLD